MANKTVRVLARITARSDKIEELRSLLLDLVKETRKRRVVSAISFFKAKLTPAILLLLKNGRVIPLSILTLPPSTCKTLFQRLRRCSRKNSIYAGMTLLNNAERKN